MHHLDAKLFTFSRRIFPKPTYTENPNSKKIIQNCFLLLQQCGQFQPNKDASKKGYLQVFYDSVLDPGWKKRWVTLLLLLL